jgi:uncharacterized membrane protein YedE/YeeE
MTPTEFTPVASLLGGVLIGLVAVTLMAVNGRIAGISGIAVRMFPPYLEQGSLGRVAFILGLVAAPVTYAVTTGALPTSTIAASSAGLVAAGLLVGFGSIWGNGCTSGHGVCGLSRLSKRSFVAVATFMTTAAITVFIVRHVI